MDTNYRNGSVHKIIGLGPVFPFPHQTKQIIVDFTTTHNDFMSPICYKRDRFSGENEVILDFTTNTHSTHGTSSISKGTSGYHHRTEELLYMVKRFKGKGDFRVIFLTERKNCCTWSKDSKAKGISE